MTPRGRPTLPAAIRATHAVPSGTDAWFPSLPSRRRRAVCGQPPAGAGDPSPAIRSGTRRQPQHAPRRPRNVGTIPPGMPGLASMAGESPARSACESPTARARLLASGAPRRILQGCGRPSPNSSVPSSHGRRAGAGTGHVWRCRSDAAAANRSLRERPRRKEAGRRALKERGRTGAPCRPAAGAPAPGHDARHRSARARPALRKCCQSGSARRRRTGPAAARSPCPSTAP